MQTLTSLAQQGLIRKRLEVSSKSAPYIDLMTTTAKKEVLNFSSNDYLGLAEHPTVLEAANTALKKYGLGSTSSPSIIGYYSPNRELEETFAYTVNRESSLLFNSGYHANLAVMQCFADKDTTIIADKLIHASLIDGAQLSAGTLRRYPHLNTDRANQLAQSNSKTLLVTESLFSMEGDLADTPNLSLIADQHKSSLIVDDAHGFGVLENFGIYPKSVRLTITPLGKALGGMGALVSGSKEDIEFLHQHARSYRYSTALPPALVSGTLKALALMSQEHWRREKLMENIDYFNTQAKAHNIPLLNTLETPIRIIPIGCNEKVQRIQQQLLDNENLLVSAIRPPTVPKDSARLRLTLTAMHEKSHIDQLVYALGLCL